MNKVDKDTLIKLLIITVLVLGYLYFFNNDCKELKKEIEEMTIEGEGENCPPSPNNDTNYSDWVPEDDPCQCWEGTESTSIKNSRGENVKRCAPSKTTTTDNITCGNTDGNNTQFDCSGSDNPLKPDAICTGDPPVCVETTCCVPQPGADAGEQEEQEETTTQGPGRCIPNTLLYSCNKWNSLMDPQIRSCATHTNRESCEYEKVHGPGGDPPDFNADPPYRGFIIPEGAGTNPSLCEYSNGCPVQHSEWRNNPERVNPPTSTNNDTDTDTQEPSEELLAAREAASAAEEAAKAAEKAADEAKTLADENPEDDAAAAAAEAATEAAIKAQAEATRLKDEEDTITKGEKDKEEDKDDDDEGEEEEEEGSDKNDVNDTEREAQERAAAQAKAALALELAGGGGCGAIANKLGKTLSSGNDERSLMETRNLENCLNYKITEESGNLRAETRQKNKIEDLLIKMKDLNAELQREGYEYTTMFDGTKKKNPSGLEKYENYQGGEMVTYTNYALLQ